jgi:hypothetical protein
MNLGGIFLLLAFVLFFLEGVGMKLLPGVDAFAHASLCLGLLLAGYPLVWWKGPP